MMSTHKEIYEALQAVNARLDGVGEQMLINLVETICTSLRQEQEALGGHARMGTLGQTEATLKIWIEVDASEQDAEATIGPTTPPTARASMPGGYARWGPPQN